MKAFTGVFSGVITFMIAVNPAFAVAQGSPNIALDFGSSIFNQGETLSVVVSIDSAGQEINAAEVGLSYSSDSLSFSSIDTTTSVFEIEAPTLESSGELTFTRASIDAASTISLFAIVNFVVTDTNAATSIVVRPDSKVIRTSDNSNILSNTATTTYEITAGASNAVVAESTVTQGPPAAGSQPGQQASNQPAVDQTNSGTASSSGGSTASPVETAAKTETDTGSQAVVMGIAGIGFLLVLFGYGYTRMSKKRGVGQSVLSHQGPHTSAAGGNGQMVSDAMIDPSAANQAAVKQDVDALLQEVHGTTAQNVEVPKVIQPKASNKIEIK